MRRQRSGHLVLLHTVMALQPLQLTTLCTACPPGCRMMQLAEEVSAAELQQPSLERLLQKRLWQAVELRRSLGLPSPATNVYRLCNRHARALIVKRWLPPACALWLLIQCGSKLPQQGLPR